MNEPSKHFKPQTRRAQLRVVRNIDDAERSMIPCGFDAEVLSMGGLHFQAAATPLAHDVGSVSCLQDQLKRANDAKRRLNALAALPLAPLEQQHRAVVARYKPLTIETIPLNDGIPVLHRVHNPQMPPRVSATAQPAAPTQKANNTTRSRSQRQTAATAAIERRSIIFVVAVYLVVIVATVAITMATRG